MKAIISGSRTIYDYALVEEAIEASGYSDRISQVISGGQRSHDDANHHYYGADYFGERWAHENNIDLKRFQARWSEHGLEAGPIRNREMAEYGDVLISIWDGESKGTRDMINAMRKLGKPIFVTVVDDVIWKDNVVYEVIRA